MPRDNPPPAPPPAPPAAPPLAPRVPGRHSLQWRITAQVLAMVVALWLAVAAAVWWRAHHELDELLDGHLAQAAGLLVAQQQYALTRRDDRHGGRHEDDHAEDDDDDHRITAPTLHRHAPRAAFQVFHRGALRLRSARAPEAPMVAAGEGLSDIVLDGHAWRALATRVDLGGGQGELRVIVAEEERSRREILLGVWQGMFWPLLLSLPLLGAGVAWAVRRGTVSLRALRQQIAQAQATALEPVALAPDAPDEVRPLVQAMNALFDRIATLLASERRFTADAAHELRTPIAAIRAQAQVALGATDDAERRHALQATLAGCDRATRLVAQLLTLSRLEAESAVSPATPATDLAALARGLLADLAGEAMAHGQTLDLEAPEPCPVAADPTLLAVLLRNLVDNALRYSPDGAEVRVAVQRGADGGVALQVDDSGPGMAEADRARLGERFFRVLGAGRDGSGLGWSIVRRIAAVQGARVAVDRSAALGGLQVRVHWPAA